MIFILVCFRLQEKKLYQSLEQDKKKVAGTPPY